MKKSVALKLYEAANEFLSGRDVYAAFMNGKELYVELANILQMSRLKYRLEQVDCTAGTGKATGTISFSFIDEEGELFMDVLLYEVI